MRYMRRDLESDFGAVDGLYFPILLCSLSCISITVTENYHQDWGECLRCVDIFHCEPVLLSYLPNTTEADGN